MKFQGFLHIDEYPPDANPGFDIPSALVSFPEFSSARSYPEIDPVLGSPLLENFQVHPQRCHELISWLISLPYMNISICASLSLQYVNISVFCRKIVL